MTSLAPPRVPDPSPVDPETESALLGQRTGIESPEAPSTRPDTSPRQVIEILVTDGYHPDRVAAAPGFPIRLVFKRLDSDPCLDRVVFSAPRIERRLTSGSTTIVDLPA